MRWLLVVFLLFWGCNKKEREKIEEEIRVLEKDLSHFEQQNDSICKMYQVVIDSLDSISMSLDSEIESCRKSSQEFDSLNTLLEKEIRKIKADLQELRKSESLKKGRK